MNIEFLEYEDKLCVRLIGELDHHSVEKERGRLELRLSVNEKPQIIIDLKGLTFMDSSAISLIYGAYKIANGFSQRVSVITDNEKFEKILTLSAMDKFVEITNGKELGV